MEKKNISCSNIKRDKLGRFTSESLKNNEFAKGNKPNKTSFKKENVPWNKGLKKEDHSSILESSIRLKKYNSTRDQRGEKNPFWKGGKSFEKYSKKWTKSFRNFIRKRGLNRCFLCNKTKIENKNRELSVHHIDYDKKNLDLNNLVNLCISCHAKTNTNRNYWKKYFKQKIREILNFLENI